jgi:hypothetical protein
VTDLRALNHILNAPEFDKTDDARVFLGDMLGKGQPTSCVFSSFNIGCRPILGLLFVEGTVYQCRSHTLSLSVTHDRPLIRVEA